MVIHHSSSNQIGPKPITTIKEARRLLGKQARNLNDIEVMEIVGTLHEAAKLHLKKNSVKKSINRLGLDSGLPQSKSK